MLIVSGVVLLVLLVVAALGGNDSRTAGFSCLSNLKVLAQSSLLYATDYDGRLMNRDRWLDQLVQASSVRSFVGSSFGGDPTAFLEQVPRCPHLIRDGLGGPAIYGYAFDSRLSERTLDSIQIASEQVLLFDSINLARNASDPLTSFAGNKPLGDKKDDRFYVSYADGHARHLSAVPAP